MRRISKLLVIGLFMTAATYGQQRARIIDWHPLSDPGTFVGVGGRLVPTELRGLELVEITVHQNPIVIGREFSAQDGWLRSFSAKVRNVSGQPITSIRLLSILPEVKYKEGTRGFTLEYGKELSTGISYGEQKPLNPGEELILTRNEQHYERDRQGLIKTNGTDKFSQVFIRPMAAKFEDGTMWFGFMQKRVK